VTPQEKRPCLRYQYPVPLVLRVGCSVLLGARRSFAADAARLYRTIAPSPRVEGLEQVPPEGGLVVVFNHYHSPSFASWWNAVAITTAIASVRPLAARESTWLMTGAWTYPDRLRQRLITPLTERAFARIAQVYGFVAMPPMPPRPHEVEARARAVRRALAIACRPQPRLIGISPEGRDSPDASLIEPPHGAGRFLLLLAASLPILPAGVFEEGPQLTVRFGPPFTLQAPAGLGADERDAWASERVMLAIAEQLPPRLWGAYHDRRAARRQAGGSQQTNTPPS
jgi:hypothetical protein